MKDKLRELYEWIEIKKIQRAIKKKGLRWKAGKTSMSDLSPEERRRRLGCLPENLIYASDDTFEKEILRYKLSSVVDFYAEWCGPCKHFAPIFEELSYEYTNKLRFAKADIDDCRKTALKYRVMSVPTTIFFYNGNEVYRLVGAMPKEKLKKEIDRMFFTYRKNENQAYIQSASKKCS